MKNIIIALLLVVVSTTAFSQDEFESYSFKTPTLYADLGLYCGAGYTGVVQINNGGYYLKRVGVLWCDDDCGGYLPIDTPGNPLVQKVEYMQGITYSGFYGDLTFAENIRCWYKGFAETNYGIEYTYTAQQVSPLCNVTPPTVTTCSTVPNITTTSGSTCGQVISEGGSTLVSWGICYNTTGNPTISSNTVSGGENPFSGYYAGFSGLTPSTTYYYRAYASNSGATAYGTEYSFTTIADATIPNVVTASISGLTETSATSGGSITSDGGGNIVVKGLEYSTNASFSSGVFSVPGGDGSGSFTSTMNSLTPCTTYYARAFAANSNGTGYGNVVAFTTNCSCNLPSFSAAYCSNPTSNSISVGATISSDGGCNITNRGFQYSTDPLFNSIAGSVSVGSGSGSYSTTITGLACGNTYFFRPFATNSAGTYYANSLVGSGCTTGNFNANVVVPLYSYISADKCGTYNFSSSNELACQAVSDYLNISCRTNPNIGGTLYGFSGRFESFSVGARVYDFVSRCPDLDTVPSAFLVYFDGASTLTSARIVHVVYGVIESITTCP